jgi:hypothetical protein
MTDALTFSDGRENSRNYRNFNDIPLNYIPCNDITHDNDELSEMEPGEIPSICFRVLEANERTTCN